MSFGPYPDAKLGLLTHALNYGTGCFEGIRAFWNAEQEQLSVFEPTAHFRRLAASANVLLMDLPLAPEELTQITAELCRRNDFRADVYIRPVIYKSDETFGVRLDDIGHDLFIVAFPNSKYLDTNEGVKACVSSWRRVDDNATPARAKITGSYVNSALAKSEARLNGFDEAIVLTGDGHVSEGSAANLYMIRGDMAITPDNSQDLLEGITRRVVSRILREELHLGIEYRAIDRTELYSADEIILCGTGVGIAWLRSLDHRRVGTGRLGPVAGELTRIYDDVTRGRRSAFGVELVPVHHAPSSSGREPSVSAAR